MKRFLIFHKPNHPGDFKLHFFDYYFLIFLVFIKKKPAGKGEGTSRLTLNYLEENFLVFIALYLVNNSPL